MSAAGTAAYADRDELPALVEAAAQVARRLGFDNSCLPEQGQLLRLLARGVGRGVIGETGTGCGVGLAWLATGAHPEARLISVELEPDRAAAAADLFRDRSTVEVRTGDWRTLRDRAPFDLLVLDGGGQGKADDPPLDPTEWLAPGGLLVLDDFTPTTTWPPLYNGHLDTAREYWLTHPRLLATQVRVTPESATILATYI